MYSIRNAHFGFKQRANKIDGLRNSSFLIPHIDEQIQQRYLIWLETICNELESNQKRRDDIRQLEILNTDLKLIKEKDYYYVELPENYYRYLESTSSIKTTTCKSKKIKNSVIQKDDRYNELMFESSYPFERVNIDISANKIYIYPKDFEATEFFLSYIRKPKRPSNPIDFINGKGKYNHPDGTPAIQQDIEVDSTFQVEKILDIAALLALRDVGNVIDFETQLNKILQISKI